MVTLSVPAASRRVSHQARRTAVRWAWLGKSVLMWDQRSARAVKSASVRTLSWSWSIAAKTAVTLARWNSLAMVSSRLGGRFSVVVRVGRGNPQARWRLCSIGRSR